MLIFKFHAFSVKPAVHMYPFVSLITVSTVLLQHWHFSTLKWVNLLTCSSRLIRLTSASSGEFSPANKKHGQTYLRNEGENKQLTFGKLDCLHNWYKNWICLCFSALDWWRVERTFVTHCTQCYPFWSCEGLRVLGSPKCWQLSWEPAAKMHKNVMR